MLFRLLFLIHVCMAFPLKCPEQAQWSFRARALCPDPSKYSCLKNDLINGFSENCTISDFQQPGRKGVLRGGLDADICSQERYHPWPIKYYTNVSTGCLFLKNVCNEEGQVVYDKGNRNTDTTCRCDYTRGYDFLAKPQNLCFCSPLKEDCSCYLKTCIESTYMLSSDYKCIHMKINTSIGNCQPVFRERVNREQNDNHTKDISRTENISLPVKWKIYAEITVTPCCIGFIIVYCIYQLLDTYYRNDSITAPGAQQLQEHDTEKNDSGHNHDTPELKDADFKNQDNDSPQADNRLSKKTLYTECYATKKLKLPDWMISKLQQWKKDEDYFVETRASNHVISCLLDNKCVSVVGPPGIGKTCLVRHVALEMENIGYNVMCVNTPNEIKQNYLLSRKLLFVVDINMPRTSISR